MYLKFLVVYLLINLNTITTHCLIVTQFKELSYLICRFTIYCNHKQINITLINQLHKWECDI